MNAFLKEYSVRSLICISLFTAFDTPAKTRSSANIEKSFGFDDVKDSLVLIQTENSVGSGFIIQNNDLRYIITNQHVILGSKSIRFRTLSGTDLKPIKVELSEARDIARLQIHGSGGVIMSNNIQKGRHISILGNSQGMGVVTWLDGIIAEVLKDRFEVTAEFVQGNSGSPVFDTNGNVLGVASYVLTYAETTLEDGTKWGPVPRRFAYELDGVRWQPVNWKAYNKKYGMTLSQIDEFKSQLYDIVIKWTENPYGKILADDVDNRDLKKWIEKHNGIIRRLNKMRDYWRFGIQPWGEDKQLSLIISDYSENSAAFTKICDDKIRLIKMLQKQRDNTAFINEELANRAEELSMLSAYARKFSKERMREFHQMKIDNIFR